LYNGLIVVPLIFKLDTDVAGNIAVDPVTLNVPLTDELPFIDVPGRVALVFVSRTPVPTWMV
jgi:hypothetical protein